MPNNNELFDIWDATGMRRIYKAMRRTSFGYDWGDGSGFLTDDTIKREGWIVNPAVIEGTV